MPKKSIKGSPGTEPIPVSAPAGTTPPPDERKATVINGPNGTYVQIGSTRIKLDDASALRLRRPAAEPRRRGALPGGKEFSALQPAIDSAAEYETMLLSKPGVVSVRAGYKFIGGWITRTPAVVVAVDRKRSDLSASEQIPPTLPSGVPTDVAIADPYEMLAAASVREAAPLPMRPRLLIDEIQEAATEAEFLEALPLISYEPPPDGNLEPVTGAMTVTCHVSPDAGWKVLEPFLKATRRKLRLGMYDFTAPHIYQAVRGVLRDSDVSWQQTLGPNESLPDEDDVDSNKANDIPEAKVVAGLKRLARERFVNAFAHVGGGRTFASAYHIKVAVRDDAAFWLSSGNWQSSNQPDIDFFDVDADRQLIPRFNREWHVVIENATLAKRFQRFLEHDFDTASAELEAVVPEAAILMPDLLVPVEDMLEEERAAIDLEVFAPRTFTFTTANPLVIQPILTPDNYLEVVLDFLKKKPARRLYFQNQSLNPVKEPSSEFKEMMRLLAAYSEERDLDARFIFRNIGPMRKKLESLQLAGFNMDRVRMQSGCHTKGIIVDTETILLGSHNFTNQGVQVNRDASLLIRHKGIAGYYERVFLHDWDKLSRPTIREESTPLPVIAGTEAFEAASQSGNIARVPFSHYLEE